MSLPSKDREGSGPVEKAATEWTLKIDRGLTAEEQDAYTQWLAEDPRHREAMSLSDWAWDELDRLAGLHLRHHASIDPDLLAPGGKLEMERRRRHRKVLWLSALPVAAAALLAFLFLTEPDAPTIQEVVPEIELMARVERRTLPDGSVIAINRQAQIEVDYSASERRVTLLRGEANFEVARQPDRPFVVEVSGVEVRALGTEFHLAKASHGVDLIVSEGLVRVEAEPAQTSGFAEPLYSEVAANQRASLSTSGESFDFVVSTISTDEIEDATLWQPRLLDFDSASLEEITHEFNQRNPIQVRLGDESLKAIRLSSTFWSDNVEGFVRLMESSFGIRAEWHGSREIVLTAARG